MTGFILIILIVVDWVVWKYSGHKLSTQHLREWMEHLKSIIPNNKGWVKYAPVIFAGLVCGVLLIFILKVKNEKVTYENPDFIGIAKVEGNHRYKLCNLNSGDCIEVDTCNSNVEWYAGHVMSKWTFINTGNCQLTNMHDPYKFVRQDPKDKNYIDWKKLHGELTYDDGYRRPVIANNCHNIKNDTDTECNGGEALFTKDQVKETANAKSARWIQSNNN